jgi:multidrug resistance protein
MNTRLNQRRNIYVLMFAAFVDMLGYGMVFPLLPFYAVRLGANAQIVGWMVASFSIAQVAVAPLWGRLSDKWGRRPPLLIGLAGSAVAFLIFGFADAIWLLFLSRIAQGASGGTTGVKQAYVADAVPPEERAKALGWLSAATNTGVMIGPALGSLTWRLGPEVPGVIAAFLCLLNLLFAWRWLPESMGDPPSIKQAESAKPVGMSVVQMVWDTLRKPGSDTSQLIWIYATAMGAFSSMTAILGLYMLEVFHMDESNIGYIFVFFGAVSVIMRGAILGHLVSALGELRVMRAGSLALAVGLLTAPFQQGLVFFLLVMGLVPIGTALLFPSSTGLLTRRVAKLQIGQLLGVQQAVGGISRILGPIWAGAAFGYLGPPVPFFIAGIIVCFVFVLTTRVSPIPAAAGQRAEASGV